jgi:hypothetical protein
VAVVYTRNDYGDGLDIDPNTHPLMPSLTDLSPAEMQEGAVRMGVNLALYFLTSGDPGQRDFLDRTSVTLREQKTDASEALPPGPVRVLDTFDAVGGWTAESWGDRASLSASGKRLDIAFEFGARKKAAVSKAYPERLGLSPDQALVVDAQNRLRCGARLALGLFAGDTYYETQPFYLKPGPNTVCFRLSAGTFKTEATGWEYRASLPGPVQVDRLTVLIYSPVPGRVTLDNLRLVGGLVARNQK